MALTKKSEYFAQLSADAKVRYECKVASAGLNVDPYCIDESQWTREPETIPGKVMWTDISLYMVSTPSPYTKEAIKVGIICTTLILTYVVAVICMLGCSYRRGKAC